MNTGATILFLSNSFSNKSDGKLKGIVELNIKSLFVYKMTDNLAPTYLSDLCPPMNTAIIIRNTQSPYMPKAKNALHYTSFILLLDLAIAFQPNF